MGRNSLLICLLVLAAFFLPFAAAQATLRCNGFQALCAKRYSEVAVALTHNAYAVGTSISANQNRPLERQLDDGIRGLKLSLLKNPKNADPNEIHLCHGQCGDTTNTIFADAGPMQIYLASIKEWLVANPNEVVTIFLENQQSYPASEIIADFEAADLARLCYAHPDDGTPWPTLRNLTRVQQKQCVVFADRVVVPGQDTVHKSQGWLHAELGFVASNYWLQTVQSAFTCKQHQPYDSGSGALIPRQLFLLNHLMYNNFSATIQVPARNQIATTNSLASIEAHVNDCLATYGRPQVNFVSVDFYEQVDYSVLRVVDALNGVQRDTYGSAADEPTTTTAAPAATTTAAATRTASQAATTQSAPAQGLTRNPPSSARRSGSWAGLAAAAGAVLVLCLAV